MSKHTKICRIYLKNSTKYLKWNIKKRARISKRSEIIIRNILFKTFNPLIKQTGQRMCILHTKQYLKPLVYIVNI